MTAICYDGSCSSLRVSSSIGTWALVGLLCLSGCGDPPEARVTGTVSFDGKAVGNGYVTFAAQNPGAGGSASGSIDSGGIYEVQKGRTGGLSAGRYLVAISVRGPSKPNPNGGPPAPGKLLIPEKYTQSDSSGLVVDVEPGSNVIDLELTSQ